MPKQPETLVPTSKIQRSTNVLLTELDGEIVVMHLSSGKIIGMADTGRRVWDALEAPISLNDLTDQLIIEYSVDRETCFSETHGFVASLLATNFCSSDWA